MKLNYLITVIFSLVSLSVFSQQKQDLEVYSKVEDDRVYLKIQPLTSEAWYLGKTSGFLIQRKDLNGDGGFQTLTETPLKPYSEEEMNALSEEYPFVGELKAILYDMESGVQPTSIDFSTMEQKKKELEGRMFLHFYLSAMSPQSSKASGLQFVDEKAKENRQYVYRIRISDHDAIAREKEVNTFRETFTDLPELNLTGLDHSVRINWYHREFEDKYIAYKLEKSAGGNQWNFLGDAPIVYNQGISDSTGLEAGYIHEGDSLAENYAPYYYRLTAIDFFGQRVGPGNPNEVRGRDLEPPIQPSRVNASYNSGKMTITWEYPKEEQVADLKGFHIGTGESPEGPFKPVNEAIISPDARSFIHEAPKAKGRNYYIVTAIDTSGNYQHSLHAYEVVPDTIPPAVPVQLAGKADTNGVVTLTWKRGEAEDLMGYRVFRANTHDHEYVQLTKEPLQDTLYHDTIPLKTLTKEVYYKITAVDNNYNHSTFSTALEVKRPDILPPVAPKIKYTKLTDEGVRLRWVPSSSRDVKSNILLRKTHDRWEEINRFGKEEFAYTDVYTGDSELIQYAMVAQDASGLISDTSHVRAVRKIKFYQVDSVGGLEASYDKDQGRVELSWNYPENDEVFYIIYRGQEESGIRMYETAETGQRSFYDRKLQPGRKYSYAIKVKRKDGKTSPLSTHVNVQVTEK